MIVHSRSSAYKVVPVVVTKANRLIRDFKTSQPSVSLRLKGKKEQCWLGGRAILSLCRQSRRRRTSAGVSELVYAEEDG